ncbi:MAG: pyridoxamine 5'-phosphate oxidase family protein [Candidatus Omnitrophica bacterium]|nr:pyridoxamine 5'-phosphate oxidase family protein [Candidatus Omnitrophota bacterium]MBU1928418.1 pyridoxamine 5'-phosphate oxidase family protein [Candidatus Omnitrophota bacterium]MBU2034300.1 pyridoxamine 5'-phosphate oxidase family protein [Candidatus Omnitrophota bacterium]
MLSDKIKDFLTNREFVSMGTCDFSGRPNAVPKFFLKTEGNFIYLIDYTKSRTLDNLRINPKASLSFIDLHGLSGYQINGAVKIIEQGEEYEKIAKELVDRQVTFSTKRIIEGITTGKKHKIFEVGIEKDFVVFKIKIQEVVEIGPAGGLNREVIKE